MSEILAEILRVPAYPKFQLTEFDLGLKLNCCSRPANIYVENNYNKKNTPQRPHQTKNL